MLRLEKPYAGIYIQTFMLHQCNSSVTVIATCVQAGCVGAGALAVYLAINWTGAASAPAPPSAGTRLPYLADTPAPAEPSGSPLPPAAASPPSIRSGAAGSRSAAGQHGGSGSDSSGREVSHVDAETWRSAVAAVGRQAGMPREGPPSEALRAHQGAPNSSGGAGGARSNAPAGAPGEGASGVPARGHRGAPNWSVTGLGQAPDQAPGAASPLEEVPFVRLLGWLLRRLEIGW